MAAPVGPIGILTIRRTLARGRSAGFATGLGVASADALYAAVAAFSLSAIANLMTGLEVPIRIAGGAFLIYLGLHTFSAEPAEHAASAGGQHLPGMFMSAFGLTLTNPQTILAFVGIFTGSGLMADTVEGSPLLPSIVVIGVFCGSTLWWLALSTSVGLLRERFTPRVMRWVNRLSGAVIIAFALWALAGLVGR